MGDPVATLSRETEAAAREMVIDCDVHPMIQDLTLLYPYMPNAWAERFARKRMGIQQSSLTLKFLHPNGAVLREDARPRPGALPGSDPKFMLEQYIEPNGVSHAVLNYPQAGALCATTAGPDESTVLAAAFNDYFIENWLTVDPRFAWAMMVSPQSPLDAANEIRRIGSHPQICCVYLPLPNILMGNRHYWPIYAAAEEAGLPIFTHLTGPDGVYQGAPVLAGGHPESYVERFVALGQIGQSNLSSLIFTGTLERFPGLDFLFAEYGFTWVLPLLWKMDRTWHEFRHETPWVKQAPSDYVRQRIKFTTQPMDEPAELAQLKALISMLGEDLLCFSSDYPHWDNDMPAITRRQFSEDARSKVMHDNAQTILRLA